jgi:hypothetical protein
MLINNDLSEYNALLNYHCRKKHIYSLFPDWWKLLGLLVIASKAVNPALNQNQPKLGIFILPVPL